MLPTGSEKTEKKQTKENRKRKHKMKQFVLIMTRSGLLAGITLSICISNSREFYASHFLGSILVLQVLFWSIVEIEFFAQFSVDHLSYPVLPHLVLLQC